MKRKNTTLTHVQVLTTDQIDTQNTNLQKAFSGHEKQQIIKATVIKERHYVGFFRHEPYSVISGNIVKL